MKKGRILFIILILTGFVAQSQSFYAIRRERSLIAVAGLGNSSYFGDIKEKGKLLDPKPAISVGLQYYFGDRIAVRSEFTYFSLKASDENASNESFKNRNLSFTSGNFEFNTVGMLNLFPLGRRFYQRPSVNLYGLLGIGLMYMNPKAELNGTKYALQPLKTEDVSYSRFQPVIPYGIGARIKAGPFFNIAIEGTWRKTFTDYMDDVSGPEYADMSGWTDPVRIALADRRKNGSVVNIRGNADRDDHYYLLMVKIEYYLPSNFLFKQSQRAYYNKKRRSTKPHHR